MRFSLFYRDEYKAARLGAYVSRDMTLTGSILCQKNIARAEAPLGTIADLDVSFTGQVDHILPSRCLKHWLLFTKYGAQANETNVPTCVSRITSTISRFGHANSLCGLLACFERSRIWYNDYRYHNAP